MGSRKAWLGSVLVHVVLALVALVALPRRDVREPRPTSIEVIAPPPRVPPTIDTSTSGGSSGGAPAARAVEPPVTRRAPARRRAIVRPRPAPAPAPAETAPDPAAADPAAAPEPAETAAAAADGTGKGTGTGTGDGNGTGTGTGSGDGTGDGKGARKPVPAMSRQLDAAISAKLRSKARPARLIYPKRDRPEEADRLFIARLTIDSDGIVVGVKLTRGPGGTAADAALAGVWRFRYDPARDDAGRPIKSTLVQRFMLD